MLLQRRRVDHHPFFFDKQNASQLLATQLQHVQPQAMGEWVLEVKDTKQEEQRLEHGELDAGGRVKHDGRV